MGGVGSVAAEMLTRCGIGRLLMYDYDKVGPQQLAREIVFVPWVAVVAVALLPGQSCDVVLPARSPRPNHPLLPPHPTRWSWPT